MEEVKKKIKVESNSSLIIAKANSRKSLSWKNEEISWRDLVVRLATTTRTPETVKEFHRMPKGQRDQIKDVGGFVGGALKNGRRKAENLANRSLITLDLDEIKTSVGDVWDAITLLYSCELLIYSTHSHTAESPRLRLILPVARKVYADEYQAIARRIASDIGIDMFDDTTYEPSRLMYWPSTPYDGEYVFRHQGGGLLDPDKVLNTYIDWRDSSFWPVSSRRDKAIQTQIKKQEDPLEKEGLIGAFCRSYSISEAIDTFLLDEYAETRVPGRYTYLKGSTAGGLVVYDDVFAYSHHGTDPTGGMLVNAFDLVRVHLYGDLDDEAKEGTPNNRLPSYLRLLEEAGKDPKVKRELELERLKQLDEDFEFVSEEEKEDALAWAEKLSVSKKGVVEDTIDNALMVLENHPRVKGRLKYDAFSNRAVVAGGVPWTDIGTHDWTDTDDSGVRYFLENHYGITTARKIEDAKNLTFDRNKFHPVRDYLDSLTWDGVSRVESLFIDFLGAEDTVYSREVAKVHLTAAVARIYRPGCKYDNMVTLAGKQGIGKSTFINKISKGWYSDSLDTMKGKEAAELIQGVWHVELGELNATRKSDRDQVKAFLSKQDDIYRVAYARNTSRFPRQCVFWGSTNDTDFLRDPTGDRRTYPIDCYEIAPTKSVFTDLDPIVDQIWAEAVGFYKGGQVLRLEGAAADIALEKQLAHKEDTPLRGLIEEYLDRAYPADWEDLSIMERRAFIDGDMDTFTVADLTYFKDRTCVLEVWVELLGKKKGDLKPLNSREINDILRSFPEWERSKGNLSFGPEYGKQRGYIRVKSAI